MRVVLTSPRYEPYLGGVETHTREIAQRMAEHGCDVYVVTSNPGKALSSSEILGGVNIVRIPTHPKGGDFYFSPGIGNVLRNLSPDVIHIQGYQSAFSPLAAITSIRSRIPTVMTLHGGAHSNPLRHALYPLQRRVLSRLYRKVDRLIVVARFELEIYPQELGIDLSRFVHIPNGCDISDSNAPRLTDGSHLTSLGRLEKSKGHDRVIQAFSILASQAPSLRLRIIGRGPDEKRLRHMCAELDVVDRVDFKSFQVHEREEMARCLADSCLIISMSQGETQPIAILEAASLGCSVLVSLESRGMQELVEDGLAVGISGRASTSELVARMDGLIVRPHVPIVTKLKTWSQCAESTLEVYSSLTS
jgi:glycosyltransferase involved in cell wall biosynthesis